jgi:hypothetical protein
MTTTINTMLLDESDLLELRARLLEDYSAWGRDMLDRLDALGIVPPALCPETPEACGVFTSEKAIAVHLGKVHNYRRDSEGSEDSAEWYAWGAWRER